MKRTTEEEKLLKQLDIPNFRHVTVDKLIQFSSSLSKIKDPEIQKKILEQVPGFESMALECLKSYKDLIQSSFNNSSEELNDCYSSYNGILVSLQTILEENNLTFEQKMKVIDKMNLIANYKVELHNQERNHRFKVIATFGITLSSIILAISSVLGTSTKKEDSTDELDE